MTAVGALGNTTDTRDTPHVLFYGENPQEHGPASVAEGGPARCAGTQNDVIFDQIRWWAAL